MKRIILASASPRRKMLLTQGGITFETVVPVCDENIPSMAPEQYVLRLSEIKNEAACELSGTDNALVISADTIVYYDGIILGKPKDASDAARMLHALSGNTHAVYTGVTVKDTASGHRISFYEKTDVTFYDVTDAQIRDYIGTGEPLDKAGAYGVQGRGVFLVQKINGDYNNVVGLPLAHLLRILKQEFGV